MLNFDLPENITSVGLDASYIFYSFGAIGDYSRPSGGPLLSALVDIKSCNDVIKTVALRCQYKSIQRKEYIYLFHRNTWESLRVFSKSLFPFPVFYHVKCLMILYYL